MANIALGLGSNKSYSNNSPVQILSAACAKISCFVKEMEFSSVYRTGAMYVCNQDDFLNMVVLATFDGTPDSLLEQINKIESMFGRDRLKEIRNGPRPLDIDIELFDTLCVNKSNLIIPHERMLERAFVLCPLLEVLNSNKKKYETLVSKIDLYSSSLKNLSEQKIEKFLDSKDFKSLVNR